MQRTGRILKGLFASAGIMLVGTNTFALGQTLRDPMRPPAIPVAEGAASPEAGATNGLQIIKSSNLTRVAVIDGAEVRVGGKIGGSTLIALSENTAVLRNSEGQVTTLKMFPASEKVVLIPAAAATRPTPKRDRQ